MNPNPRSGKIIRLMLPFALCLILPCFVSAAGPAPGPGTVDPGFNTSFTAPGGLPNAIVVQPDGKILVGGVFPLAGGVVHSCIVRLNANGSTDTTFVGQTDAEVSAVALQSDGKILIGGYFSQVDGVARARIARLNANGTLDTTFNPGQGASSSNPQEAVSIAVKAIALQSDGKIVIGGVFDHFNGVARTSIARLNANGSLDTTFNPHITETQVEYDEVTVLSILVQPDGKIVFGGGFETVNGSSFTNLARVNADGTLDAGFASDGPDAIGSLNYTNVVSLALQSDGRIVAGGTFSSVHGTARKNVARFNTNGTLDTTFNPGAAFTYNLFGVNDVVVQANGKIVITGGFSTEASNPQFHQNSIFRVNTDGTIDNTFIGTTSRGINDGDIGDNFQVSKVAVQSNGQLIIGGDFIVVDGVKEASFARLNTNGSLDASFQTQIQARAFIFDLALQSDGKIIAGGAFDDVNGTPRYALARIKTDGTLDSTFVPDLGLGSAANESITYYLSVQHVAVQSDGRILYSAFKEIKGAPNTSPATSNPLARLNANGTPDSTFKVTFANAYEAAQDIVPQLDGKILISGFFTSINGVARSGLARLNADGSVDTSFKPPAFMGVGPTGTPATASIAKIVLQSDGKILLGGTFSLTDTTRPVDLVRLNPDGSMDTTFHAALPLVENQNFQQPSVVDVALQTDGRILVAGEFSLATENEGGDFVRLNTNGSLDHSFNGLRGTLKILPQEDGKIVVGGNFAQLKGIGTSGLARVNSNGSVDNSFDVVITDRSRFTEVPQYVFAFALQADGKILVGGTFDEVNDSTHIALVRLEGDPVSRLLNISTRAQVLGGQNVAIGGFIVTGTTNKEVLIRGIGPSLSKSGVAGALADPTLTLYDSTGALVASNDNWQTSQEAAIKATGVAPTDPRESAILRTLAPGGYTAVLAGKGSDTGVALVEVYDLTDAALSQLANISTRAFVNTGADVMIGGFIIGGPAGDNASSEVLVRAIGPSLASAGITDALANPTLALHNANGMTVASNDNWQTTQKTAIEATGLAPKNALESAILVTLAPGAYTAIVSGAGNTTGVGLVEVYHLQ